MKKLLVVLLVLVCCEGAAFAFSDADSPSFLCTGYSGKYVRVVLPVVFNTDNTSSNGTLVKMRFSSGMSGKDIEIPILDGQTVGARVTMDGYCEQLPGGPFINIHWAYDSGVDGSIYTIDIGNPLKISQIN